MPSRHAAGAEHRVGLAQIPRAPARAVCSSSSRSSLPRSARARPRAAAPRRWAGTRAAAGRAAGSSPAGPSSPRTAPRSPRAGAAAAPRARRARSSSSAMIIACILGWRSSGHEHVLGAAQADALRAELARLAGVLGRVGVGAHAQPADLVGPAEHGLEASVSSENASSGVHERHVVERDHARGAVDGDQVALARAGCRRRGSPSLLRSISSSPAPGDARLAHAARHQRRVRGLAALGW